MSDPLELAEDFVERLWNRGDVDAIDDMLSEEYVDHTLPDTDEGDRAGLLQDVLALRDAMPDLHVEIEDSYQDDDYVILKSLSSGTQRGELFGIPPSGKRAEWDGIDILRFEGDEIAERWAVSDSMALVQQLGALELPVEANPERAELIAELEAIPKQVREVVRVTGNVPGNAERWSTSTIIGHLWRVERDVWQARLEQMLREENPHWEWWEPEGFDWEKEFGGANTDALVDAFEFRRVDTCRFLRELEEEGWARRGTHTVFGNIDVMGLMQEALKHDREHLASLSGAQV